MWSDYFSARTDENRNKLAEYYLDVINQVINWRYRGCLRNSTFNHDDMYSFGFFGLMQAIEKYDPKKDVKFPTFAFFRIHGAIRDAMRKWDPLSRPQRQKDLIKFLSIDDCKPESTSYNKPFSFKDVLVDKKVADPHKVLANKDMWQKILNVLPGREQKIIVDLYYQKGFSMSQIGRVIGMTESRISQIFADCRHTIYLYFSDNHFDFE